MKTLLRDCTLHIPAFFQSGISPTGIVLLKPGFQISDKGNPVFRKTYWRPSPKGLSFCASEPAGKLSLQGDLIRNLVTLYRDNFIVSYCIVYSSVFFSSLRFPFVLANWEYLMFSSPLLNQLNLNQLHLYVSIKTRLYGYGQHYGSYILSKMIAILGVYM